MRRFLLLLTLLATLLSLCFALTSCNIIKQDTEEEEDEDECSHIDRNNDNRCDRCKERVYGIHKHKDKDEDDYCDYCDGFIGESAIAMTKESWKRAFDFYNVTITKKGTNSTDREDTVEYYCYHTWDKHD